MKILQFGVAVTFLALSACSTAQTEGDFGAETKGDGFGDDAVVSTEGYVSEEVTIDYGSVNELSDSMKNTVNFGYDSYYLEPSALAILKEQAYVLKNNPDIKVVIEGHCDERGTREYNIALGERRANAVKNFLSLQGVNSENISVVSYGKERPLVIGSDNAAMAKNRRAVTVVE